MATRSFIGKKLENGNVKSIYCHFDGYVVGGVGEMLNTHYLEEDKIDALLALGSISSLGESVECPEGHRYENAVEGHTVAYMRDRGETDQEADEDTLVSFMDLGEICYLFEDGVWKIQQDEIF